MPTSKILTLRNECEYKCIDLTELLYVCVDDYLSSFHSANHQKFTCTKSLLEVESNLPDNFFRINRNIIVNIHSIDTFKLRNRKIYLSNSVEFIVSCRRIKQLQVALTSRNLTITGWVSTLTSYRSFYAYFKFCFHNIVQPVTSTKHPLITIQNNLFVTGCSLRIFT